MKKYSILLIVSTFVMMVGCSRSNTETAKQASHGKPLNGEANILQSWQGDFPVVRFDQLPENQRDQGIGFIDNAETFEGVWNAFKPGDTVPNIDFKNKLVLFARNTQFNNRIRIGKVKAKNGLMEVLAMETMSAMPIEDKVAISLVVVPRNGIRAIQTGDKIIPVN